MNRFIALPSVYKLATSLVAGIAAYIISYFGWHNLLTALMLSWDAFSLVFISMSWVTFLSAGWEYIRARGKKEDESGPVIFTLVLIATLLSFFIVIAMLHNVRSHVIPHWLGACIYISGIICSWVLLHTIFCLHYAHLYYGDDPDDATTHAGGLKIPGHRNPDYLDFAYYSFVVGMTYQVSDIIITSRKLRRLTLLHSILSFAFNTIIVALTINEIVNFK